MPHPVPPPVPPPQIHVLPAESSGKHIDVTEVSAEPPALELHPVLPADDTLDAPPEAEAAAQIPPATPSTVSDAERLGDPSASQHWTKAEDDALLQAVDQSGTGSDSAVSETPIAVATAETRRSEPPIDAFAVASPETYTPEFPSTPSSPDRPAPEPVAIPLEEVPSTYSQASVLGDRIEPSAPFSWPVPGGSTAEATPIPGLLSRRRTSRSLDDQQFLLEGEVDLFPMLVELQQLSGATLVARTRGEEGRTVLELPQAQAQANPNFNPPRLEPTTGVGGEDDDEEEPPADPPSFPDFDRPDTGDTEESTDADDSDRQLIRPETGVSDGDDEPSEAVGDSKFPPSDRPGIPDSEVTDDPESPLPSVDVDGLEVDLGTSIPADVLELDADRQDFDTVRNVFVAEGNVELRFRQAILTADRIRVNLNTRQAVADGNVVFRRGQQLLLGNRLDYNLTQATGNISGVRGEIFLPTSDSDLTILPNDASVSGRPGLPLDETLDLEARQDAPIATGEGFEFGVGTEQLELTGGIRRLRFEAESAVFFPDGWQATNVRITNDPFSPPELELRSPEVTYRRLSPLRAEIIARNPSLVFDQEFRIPLFQQRIIIDNRRRNNNPPLFDIGFDDDLGGLFLRRPFNIITTLRARFTVSPLLLVQRALEDNGGNIFSPNSFGAEVRFNYTISPTTRFRVRSLFESLDFETSEDITASVQLIQRVGTHQITAEFAYRNEFFNGSLGEREVLSSFGAVLTSPLIELGDTGLRLSYQAGMQYVTAETNRRELLDDGVNRDEVGLFRAQASATLSRTFRIWRGRPLPRTREEGLRFSPTPVVPFLNLVTSLRGTTTYYSNDDTQSSLRGSIGLRGQLGHFSRDFFDYTGFNVTFTEALVEGQSPFFFDRDVDRTTLSFGILQQVVGPIRVGFQSSFNLDTGREINTVYRLQYVRRTYSINLSFSPIREEGSLTLQINDFDWRQPRDPFSGGAGAGDVEGGVLLSE
ncbi:DUF3769 domain-containing protein [Vacuolonema iberomarrocanum]|uniref:DUF3769 domain-containing protein n=1 Tax=Vacuolonema iberomarrocanum TaxID=3454632 RepID=UPI0019E69AEC|nr:DUF3769 domain-containing protein [filamentous cyanobacterium LEGE 07170]